MFSTLEPDDLNHLPLSRTILVGREGEIAEARRLLCRDGGRWLTLIGPGGVGKTRLALELAAQPAAVGCERVCFVSLAPVRDPAMVLPEVMRALGISDDEDRRLFDKLAIRLGSERLLLVLDNMEQVTASGPAIVHLLTACPTLTVVATSRSPLHLSGEQVLVVPPLAVPDLAALPSLSDLAQTGAIALFVARGQVVDPDFALSELNATTIAAICARLDGLPLAIELAALRLQVLSPAALLERLTNRLALLTRGAAKLPDRQRTLRATIAWSDDLLGPMERSLFRCLAVFPDGCDTVAAEMVCGEWIAQGDDAATGSLLNALAELLDTGLLQRVMSSDEPRFAMLETIQEYALEELDATGATAELRRRHAGYFLDLAERAEPELSGAEQRRWLDRLEAEHGNIRTALAWAIRHDEDEIALRLAAALWKFWWLHGHLTEGREWFDRILDRGEHLPVIRAKALNAAGELAERHHDYDRAVFWYTQVLPLWESLGDHGGHAATLAGLGFVAMRRGRYEEAVKLQEQALAIYRQLGDRRRISEILNNLGTLLLDQGHYDRAQALCSEALELYQSLQDALGISIALQNLGYVAFLRQDHALAESLYQQSLAGRRELGDPQGVAHVLANLGENARHRGDVTLAIVRCEEALHLFREIGDKRGTAYACYELGQAARDLHQTEKALPLLTESLALFFEVGERWAIARCLEALAGVWANQGNAVLGACQLGAASRIREDLEAPVQAVDQDDYAWSAGAIQSKLTAGRYAQIWASGEAMPLDEVVNAAGAKLAELERSGSDAVSPESVDWRHPLSAREMEVLRLLVQGCTDREIAESLSISPRTASTHMTNIFRKLGESSRTAVVAYAVRHHLG